MTRIPIDDDNNMSDVPENDQRDQGAASGALDEMQQLREERDTFYDRWIRSKADSENMRKRMQSEFDQRLQYANEGLIRSLLPVIDNFERALSQDPSKVDPAAILRGMQIVHDEWMRVLKQQSVDDIAPEVGTSFDPSQHEALMQQESQYKSPTVTQLLQKGYALRGRTLRPAKVAVSK